MHIQTHTFNQEFVMSQIKDTKFLYDGTLTICILTTLSNFKIVATSNVVNEENYSKDRGREIAYKKAIDQLTDYCSFYIKTITHN